MHLRYDMFTAIFDRGENRHPQEVMRNLDITYQHATPQSIADEWWFWNCENVPEPLPKFLTELKLDPYKAVGYGLSPEDAKRISEGANGDSHE